MTKIPTSKIKFFSDGPRVVYDPQDFIVIRQAAPGVTLFLNIERRRSPSQVCQVAPGEATWMLLRKNATLFPTWRKGHNAAKKFDGLVSPAHCYPE